MQPGPVDRDGKALVMLVQINFAEMPPLAGYPTEGVLQLYVSPGYDETQGWGMRMDDVHETERRASDAKSSVASTHESRLPCYSFAR